MHLSIAFSSSVVFIAAVGGFVRHTWPSRMGVLEGRFLGELHSRTVPVLIKVFHAITMLSNTEVLLVLLPLIGLILLKQGMTRGFTHLLLVATAGGGALTFLLKELFGRARPGYQMLHVPGYSFPSGHSSISFCLFGSLAYLLYKSHLPKWQKYLGIVACGVLVLAIGFSRLYLGVHYPTDVIAGYFAGAIWLTGCIFAYRRFCRVNPAE